MTVQLPTVCPYCPQSHEGFLCPQLVTNYPQRVRGRENASSGQPRPFSRGFDYDGWVDSIHDACIGDDE